jgi:flagellar basal-body rod modification protein FlgD
MTTLSSEIYSLPTAATNAGTKSSAAAKEIMGKEDFLTLLVAQLKNQDPLSPDDPTEFTAQLAQFSSLEQLHNLNDSMQALATAQGSSEKLSALSLIGQNISYYGSAFTFDGQPVEVGYNLDSTAASVTLSIQNEKGQTVSTMQAENTELAAGNHFINWDGKDQNGNPVPSGKYNLILQANAAGENSTIAAAPLIRSEVIGVDLSTGMLTTKDGEVLLKDVLKVLAPGGSPETATALTNIATNNTATGMAASLPPENNTATADEQRAQEMIDLFIQQTQP